MEHQIAYTQLALNDLKEIEAYIALDSQAMAQKWVQKIIDRIQQLRRFPEMGKLAPEFESPEISQIVLGKYKIVYRIKTGQKKSAYCG